MSGFITKAACAGHRPSQFAGYSGFQRTLLMARLLKDRSIARFVVAPSGYGKTSLLVEYAETMFSWAHVFWVNGQSPCFIRDVDEGGIADDCKRCDASARLVVFDDVPLLDAERARMFSREIDALLGAGCEVVVACTPQCDVFGKLQRDRVRLGASEMLLNDEEIDIVRGADERARNPSARVPPSGRVPALAWREGADAALSFVRGALKEPMPSDMLLYVGSMLVLQKGSLRELEDLGPAPLDSLEAFCDDYPHFGIDADTGRFEAPSIALEDIQSGIRAGLANMVDASTCDTREQLIWSWADVMMREQEFGRACDIVRVLCARGRRASWLAEHVDALVSSGRFLEGVRLAWSARLTAKDATPDERAVCLAYEALCHEALGDEDGAARCAMRLAFEETAAADPRICCLIILARCASSAVSEHAGACLREMVLLRKETPLELLSPWQQLALFWKRLEDGEESAAHCWDGLHEASARGGVLCLAASWLYLALALRYAHRDEGGLSVLLSPFAQIERYVRHYLRDPAHVRYDYFGASAGLALERASSSGMPLADGPLPGRMLFPLHQSELDLLDQKTAFDNLRDVDAPDSGIEWPSGQRLTSAMASKSPLAKRKRAVPLLKVRMFGRFEVMIGDDSIEDEAFRRKHVRLLLLLLLMNAGRDISRNTLARMLWPEADEDNARRSFYAVWSKLKKALMLSDGTCPYLVRHQFGCGLESRYVESDVMRLSAICRELLFGKPDSNGWHALYAEIEDRYSNELLPSEENDSVVAGARVECRNRLVDALISAAQSSIDGESKQLAVWFARCAVGHDETREDAYVTLMRAQYEMGQRTAAMQTYHRCRRVLSEKLGVDPAPETVALYEMLLDSL